MIHPGKLMQQLGSEVLDILFPRRCISCGKFDTYLCTQCFSSLPINIKQCCPFCGQPTFFGETCFRCKKNTALDGAWVVSDYQNQILKNCIKAYKYYSIHELSEEFFRLIKYFVQQIPEEILRKKNFLGIIPVPMHKKRILLRGLHHTEDLSKIAGQIFHLEIFNTILVKIKNTQPQAELNGKDRLKNVGNSFSVFQPEKVKNKNILLFDDVLTTGATLNECASTLKKAGARVVWALVLARG